MANDGQQVHPGHLFRSGLYIWDAITGVLPKPYLCGRFIISIYLLIDVCNCEDKYNLKEQQGAYEKGIKKTIESIILETYLTLTNDYHALFRYVVQTQAYIQNIF